MPVVEGATMRTAGRPSPVVAERAKQTAKAEARRSVGLPSLASRVG